MKSQGNNFFSKHLEFECPLMINSMTSIFKPQHNIHEHICDTIDLCLTALGLC